MRIIGSGVGLQDPTNVERLKTPTATRAPVAPPPTTAASTRASQIHAVVDGHKAAQAAHIAALQREVREGTYRVDLQKLAEKIADEELAGASRR